jgi:flagellin
MPVSISNNAQLKESHRHLAVHQAGTAKQIAQLSSGQRLNRSSDDPASLSLADGINAELQALTQGTRNIQQSVSLLQIADGALGEMNNMVRRMNTLASQSASSIFNDNDRIVINNEFQELKDEIDRIADSTTYNQIPLLNSDRTFVIQIGPSETSNDLASISMGDLRATSVTLNMRDMSLLTEEDGRNVLSQLEHVLDRIIGERNKIGAFQNRLELSATTSTSIIERMRAVESSFRDVDVARSAAELSQSQILGQAAASIAVESRTNIHRVLALLQ